MKTASIIIALGAALVPAALASPAVPLFQDALDWTASGISHIGESQDGGVGTTSSWTFVDCGDVSDAIEIKSLRVVPDPPQPGKKMTIYADGTAKQRIDEGAYADVVVKLGLIKIIQKRFDVCEELYAGIHMSTVANS
ncbi:Phosphatidylglycerol/phosphatidylinositol transfer protein [Cystobasidiomycetes sp. EMM_F5]